MKIMSVALVVILSACTTTAPSLKELETTAMLTGDWSAVEKREQALQRRAERHGAVCPRGMVNFCVDSFGKKRCACVRHSTLRGVLGGY